jgi:5,10-methylenetetrahydrofolate reductase
MEKETVKLINVLRRIARSARYAASVKFDPESTRFCVTQYNKVLARLSELEPGVKTLFMPLAESASPEITRIAARELAAYFEDEAPETHSFKFAWGCGPRRHRARGFPFAVRCE